MLGGLAAAALLAVAALARDVAAVGRLPERFALGPDEDVEVALVPSGDPGGQRTLAAVALYRRGQAGHIVISGAGYGGDSAELLADVARSAGIPEVALTVEPEATNTWENLRLGLSQLARPPRSLAVVTHRAHALRAGLVAEHLAPGTRIRVVVVPAEIPVWGRLREGLALLVYRLRGRVAWD